MDDYILVASGTQKGMEQLISLLPFPRSDIVMTHDAASARRLVAEKSFKLIVINSPLKDEFGHELAIDVSMKTAAGVVMIVKGDVFDEVNSRVEQSGVFTVSKPIAKQSLEQAVRLGVATHSRIFSLAQEKEQLVMRIEEMKLVNRAKSILTQVLNMSEAEAHRYITKQAMDLRTTKRSVARDILNMYGR